MIRTIIIEDEKTAADRMERLLLETDPEIWIVAKLESIHSSVEWFRANPHPDLIILDIQLADGVSFEIFRQVEVDSFVVFTTAYDEYAIKAFELNSIDYLLKPIQKPRLENAIEKYKKLKSSGSPSPDIRKILDVIENRNKYKERFLINTGSKILSISVNEAAYFYSTIKTTFMVLKENREYPVDFSLDNLEKMLDPNVFFRISRQFLVNFESLGNIYILSKSRIRVELNPPSEEDVYVSKGRTHEFREWLDR